MIGRIVRWLDERTRPALGPVYRLARRRPLLSVAAYSAVLVLAGLAAGNWAGDNDVKEKAREAFLDLPIVRQIVEQRRTRGLLRQTIAWSWLPDTSNLHHLEQAIIRLAPFDTYGDGGAIAEIEGAIVFASPIGQLGYLSRDHELRALAPRVPMQLDELLAHRISRDPRFVMNYFRTLDLLPVQTGPGAYDLYVSHHRFNPTESCFDVVVSRTSVTADDAGLHADGGWDEIFVAAPCMPTKDIDLLWGGLESGGRMVLRDPRTLLLSIGDHQFDGVRWPVALAQDPSSHLGKIVAIDLVTREARIYVSGLRNPQGLLVASDGTIWETEHGPQGGDEVNIVREGTNYGWPLVTYGMDYGWRPRLEWPLNPEQGRHDGYQPPAFSFVPSIGIGNIIEPDAREFPLWRDHLLIASLGGYEVDATGTLFVLKIEDGDDPIYAEPIRIEGERLRDMITLADGRIAILTDNRNLILLRNEDRLPGQASSSETEFVVTLADDVAAAAVATSAGEDAPPAERGRQAFSAQCATCHALDGTARIGPPLDGVLGRRVGSAEGFGYSPALTGRDELWNERRLIRFLTEPGAEFEGTTMPPAPVTREDAAAIVEFLAQE